MLKHLNQDYEKSDESIMFALRLTICRSSKLQMIKYTKPNTWQQMGISNRPSNAVTSFSFLIPNPQMNLPDPQRKGSQIDPRYPLSKSQYLTSMKAQKEAGEIVRRERLWEMKDGDVPSW